MNCSYIQSSTRLEDTQLIRIELELNSTFVSGDTKSFWLTAWGLHIKTELCREFVSFSALACRSVFLLFPLKSLPSASPPLRPPPPPFNKAAILYLLGSGVSYYCRYCSISQSESRFKQLLVDRAPLTQCPNCQLISLTIPIGSINWLRWQQNYIHDHSPVSYSREQILKLKLLRWLCKIFSWRFCPCCWWSKLWQLGEQGIKRGIKNHHSRSLIF